MYRSLAAAIALGATLGVSGLALAQPVYGPYNAYGPQYGYGPYSGYEPQYEHGPYQYGYGPYTGYDQEYAAPTVVAAPPVVYGPPAWDGTHTGGGASRSESYWGGQKSN